MTASPCCDRRRNTGTAPSAPRTGCVATSLPGSGRTLTMVNVVESRSWHPSWFPPMPVLTLMVLACGLVRLDGTRLDAAEQGRAAAFIESLGGKVTVDENEPDRPVVEVDFSDTEVTDADLSVL